MNKYTIDEQYLTQVTVSYGYTHQPSELFPNGGFGTTMTTVDHPSFNALRELLGNTGMIYVERGWWNGDYVLTPFTLNDKVFKKGDRFVSAGAMKYELNYRGENDGV